MTPEETRLRAIPDDLGAYADAVLSVYQYETVGQFYRDLAALLSEVERLRTKSERLAGALRFYASTNAWRSSTVYMCGHSGPPQAVLDGGQKALRALAQEGEG